MIYDYFVTKIVKFLIKYEVYIKYDMGRKDRTGIVNGNATLDPCAIRNRFRQNSKY